MLAKFMSEIRRRRVLNVVTPYLLAAWLIIQIVVTVTPALRLAPWVQSAVVMLAIVGFPIACYLAWFFDFTSDGIKRTPGLRDGAVLRPLGPVHWAGLAATMVFALAGGYAGFKALDGNRTNGAPRVAAPDNKSVAVLPFDDLSPSQDLGYLAQGLAEEITVALGKLGNMRISAPSSSFRAAEEGSAITEIAARLGVGAVLTGSVRRSGDQLRVTAALISAGDGLTIWTDAFSRTFDDLVAVEEQIARSILNTMLDRFLADEDEALLDRPKASDAHDFYLRGRAAMRVRTTESLKEARTFFEQTITADPEYAPGYAGLAATLLLLSEGERNYGTLDRDLAADLAARNVDKALERKPDLAEAHAVKGRVAAFRGDADAALKSYDAAIALNSSYADAYLWRSNLLLSEQRLTEASESLDEAYALDPLSPVVLYNKGFHLALRGEFDEARTYYNALLDLEPASPLGYRGLADAARRQGDIAESARTWKRALEASPDSIQYKDNLVSALLTLEMADAARPFAGRDFETNLQLIEGHTEIALGELQNAYRASADDPWVAFEAGWYELLYGEEENAFDPLIAADEGLANAAKFDMPYCSPAIEAAYVYQVRGDAPQASLRIEECSRRREAQIAEGARSTELDYLGARLAMLSGDAESAGRLLRQAFDGGWREPWSKADPLLVSRSGTAPAPIAAVLRDIDADLQRQREGLEEEALAWRNDRQGP
ncbi:MAG: tetratricopeptide repeat protein [Parvularcula sp.]|jgi:TolB-like protein/Tfp pilus assembly protein PilF|nr:tetratricopeptide repeat protein [Parvularcula sp.]